MSGGRFPEVMLGVSAAVWVGFAAWLFANPAALSAVGVGVETPTGRAEVRAFYGGLEFGIGLFLAWCLFAGSLRAGLVASLIFLACAGLGRLAGAAMEGFDVGRAMYGFAAVELGTAVGTAAALWTLSKRAVA